MPQGGYLPEGSLLNTPQNRAYTQNPALLQRAMEDGRILEATAVHCDAAHNLTVELGGAVGIIPRVEAAVGIESGRTREIAILSRVGKPVCFQVMGMQDGRYILSRRRAQEQCMEWFMQTLCPGDVIRARVTHLEAFGAFVDIGCGNASLIGIENISVSRIAHPRERFYPKQEICAVVTSVDPEMGRICLSHRELLGTWEQNAARLAAGETVGGIVRGIEDYGVFVEMTPNLSGLAERHEGVHTGMPVAVYIKSIIPERMKIKLVIIDALECSTCKSVSAADYYITGGHIDRWRYTPECSTGKLIETIF